MSKDNKDRGVDKSSLILSNRANLQLVLRLAINHMDDYKIDVTAIEELQNIGNTDELERIFGRAKTAVVNGAKVILLRKEFSGETNKFDELDTLEDLETYRKKVFKYLS